ncbi:MAG: M23 family metallopeptidase [Deltaproteobacteria bacterium]|nr:M23 family metallopeptidase [Deltaproteobacteria bacterium]
MLKKKKNTGLYLTITLIVLVLGAITWFLMTLFESEKPQIQLEPLPDFLTGKQDLNLHVKDMKRGLRSVTVSLKQGGREITAFEKQFPFSGLFNADGIHRFDTTFSLDPGQFNLRDGRVDLEVTVRDYSRRNGGDGNLALMDHKMTLDTIPPAIRAISRLHYINVGGAGLVVYQASSDALKSGIYVNTLFFPGYPVADSADGYHVCYFGIPLNIGKDHEIYLWAEDKAGNQSNAVFYCRVKQKRFRTEKINITDRFLNKIFPYFSDYLKGMDAENLDKFLKINQELREKNTAAFAQLKDRTSADRLWSGVWTRLENAANMARFGDRRKYYYKGKEVDQQTHLGVDLASLANSHVQAANSGTVIFAGNMGIYGKTVVLDHGQGLASTYSHLNGINVELGQEMAKGDVIGTTGQTGLAGGDHLHFGVMVNGLFVNPIEWWDPHWIEDNVTRKLNLMEDVK